MGKMIVLKFVIFKRSIYYYCIMDLKNKLLRRAIYLLFFSSSWVFSQIGGDTANNLEGFFEQNFINSFQQSHRDSLVIWNEQVILHLDNEVYFGGAPIFFKAHVVSGRNKRRDTQSKVLNIELLNHRQEIVSTQFHKINDGISSGSLVLPKSIESGIYKIRAYTRWMKNYGSSIFFEKDIIINSESKNLDFSKSTEPSVLFYPEGGSLIAGLENRLLIKPGVKVGSHLNFSGYLVDSNGKEISKVTPFGSKMMSVIFTPVENERYYLKIGNGDQLELPQVLKSGYILNASVLKKDAINVRVQANTPSFSETLVLKGEMGGIVYFSKDIDLEDRSLEMEIPKTGIPSGILKIYLLDKNSEVLSQRPVFIDRNEDIQIELISFEQLKDNELSFKISLKDEKGNPVETEFSVSVVERINEYRELLDRNVNDFYLDENFSRIENRTDRFIKDMEFLASFSAENSLGRNFPEIIKYPFQQGLELTGFAYDLDGNLLKNTLIQMVYTSNNKPMAKELLTDEEGRFHIKDLDFYGENDIVFRTKGTNTKSRLVKVIPLNSNEKKYREAVTINNTQVYDGSKNMPFLDAMEDREVIRLKEVEITENKIEQKRSMPPVYGLKTTPARTVLQDLKKPKALYQMLSEIPGIIVSGNLEYPNINRMVTNTLMTSGGSGFPSGSGEIRSSRGQTLDASGPLWVIDGLIWGNDNGITPEMGLSSWEVERIEFLSPADAGIYGSRASQGVFLIYTRNGKDVDYLNRKEGTLTLQGYHISQDFDNYKNDILEKPKKYMGKPITHFWSPSLKTDANGEATVSFVSPIEHEKLEINIRTITPNGRIGTLNIEL